MIGYLNPGIEPRNDWELLQLGVKRYQGGQAEVYAALDKEFKLMSEDEDLMETQEDWDCALNTVFEPTGIKPYPGEEDECIQIRPIPDTKYSIRLFPGSFTDAEYCMDFVDNETGEAVNSPFPFELFAGGGETDTPWLNFQGSMKVASIERIFGHKQGEILPGEEKFILRDGQMCVLTRPGKPKIRFTVPIRVHPENRPVEETDVIHLDFPKKITLAP
ncbi:hypothetical protein ONZ51_g5097 [Trametes cubensis]|uniref:Uncharacterized protein n=1 Tax=Trametes cubensis TaxID=1111947 RepID=A0AAD7TUT1_9APHY|nr:hypothetical protein ONZ51_g5097 [Trametes cubensis]